MDSTLVSKELGTKINSPLVYHNLLGPPLTFSVVYPAEKIAQTILCLFASPKLFRLFWLIPQPG